MFNFILGIFKSFFGTRAERQLKSLRQEVAQINRIWAQLAQLSDDALRDETTKLRAQIMNGVAAYTERIATLQVEAKETTHLKKQYALFQKLEKIKFERKKRIRAILSQVMHKAFAIVKETARRFKENEEIAVTATDFDRTVAETKAYVTIEGDKAHWKTSWNVGGRMLKWGMVHFDVQLMGGIVLHRGKIAEMATGEGKTLAATLPAFLNALSGEGVHIWTVNDYLSKRDAAWNAPIFEFHGISVGCIEGTPIQSALRKKAYAADITYGTSSSFGFDYLYDNIAKDESQQVQRDYNYVIIDEIDSVAIDEARTPLIISGPVQAMSHKTYRTLKPRIKNLYQQQQKLVVNYLNEAKEKIKNNEVTAAGLALLRAYRGLPTYKPLISYLSETGIKKILSETEDIYLQENSKLMPVVDSALFFTIDKKYGKIDLTDKGVEHLTQKTDGEDFFVLSDLASETNAINADPTLSDQEKAKKKAEATASFSEKSERIHAANQLLKAFALYERNRDYVVMNGEVKIVDEKTGRILGSRRYSKGLHQALEAKEDVEIKRATQTFASITITNLIRRYPWKSGMTGTAQDDAVELLDIYKLPVVSIAPNRPNCRKDLPDRVYKTKREKYHAIARVVAKQHTKGVPVLLITPSVEDSEAILKLLNKYLKNIKTKIQVLNAKHHHLEAEIIAKAGKLHAITIATNMAGRGTDIKIEDAALAIGGLFVIITEKGEITRVDRQSRGRCARQGQPGTTLCFLSLEDPPIRHWEKGPIGKRVDKIWSKEGEVISDPIIDRLIESVQKDKQQNYFQSRKVVLEYDTVKRAQCKIFFKKRNHILRMDRLEFEIMQAIRNTIINLLHAYRDGHEQKKIMLLLAELLGQPKDELEALLLHENLKLAFKKICRRAQDHYQTSSQSFADQVYQKLVALSPEQSPGMRWAILPMQIDGQVIPVEIDVEKTLATKGQHAIQEAHKSMILVGMDLLWGMHLQHMEYLQEDVRNANYEQKSPLLIFKAEGLKMLQQCLKNLDIQITRTILNHTFNVDKMVFQSTAANKEVPEGLETNQNEHEAKEVVATPIVSEATYRRNDRVTVQYEDGTTKTMKYKTVEKDIEEGKCKIIDTEK